MAASPTRSFEVAVPLHVPCSQPEVNYPITALEGSHEDEWRHDYFAVLVHEKTMVFIYAVAGTADWELFGHELEGMVRSMQFWPLAE